MLTSLNWTLMHIIDVAVVGHYGTGELAALAASRTLTFIAIVMGFSGLSGVLVFASRADGGGRLAETGDIFRSGLGARPDPRPCRHLRPARSGRSSCSP